MRSAIGTPLLTGRFDAPRRFSRRGAISAIGGPKRLRRHRLPKPTGSLYRSTQALAGAEWTQAMSLQQQSEAPSPAPSSRGRRAYTARKQQMLDITEQAVPEREQWVARHSYYYEEDRRYLRFLVPEGKRVLDLGCGMGDLLASLKPSKGVDRKSVV